MLASEADDPSALPVDNPFGMLPWCIVDRNEYAARWLGLGRKLFPQPRVFQANWFRRDPDGRPLWPGHVENARVLEWIVNRLRGQATARSTVAGLVPKTADFDVAGLSIGAGDALFTVDPIEWRDEATRHAVSLASRGRTVPFELIREHGRLCDRIEAAVGSIYSPTYAGEEASD
jgi:phosphoenolpyruvate carboxykinase (GTP)